MLDFLSIDTGTIIFTLINTLILFMIIKHLLFGRVNKIIEERQADVTNTYKKADESLENAKKQEETYNNIMANAKDEAAQIVKSATQKALIRSDEIMLQAKNNANNVLEKANLDIEREKIRAKNEIKYEISDIALMMAQKVISKEIDKKDHEKLINDFIENVGDL
jgi:F-type H+-transporting ATPase subunit b